MRKIFLITFLLLVSGCAAAKQAEVNKAWEKANAVELQCDQRRLQGEFKTYLEVAKCSNEFALPIVRNAVGQYAPYVDALFSFKLILAEKLDKGEMTESQARFAFAEYKTNLMAKSQVLHSLNSGFNQQMLESGLKLMQQDEKNSSIHCNTTAYTGGDSTISCY